MERLTIRRLTPKDALAAERIARQSPQAGRWETGSYTRFPGWVAELCGEIAGFILVRIAADEMEILNIAVSADQRHRGIGSQLIAAAFDFGRESGARRVFLEVRESNEVAQLFYRYHRFESIGRRRLYYHDPEEDALLLACSLDSSR